jgi:hypothetical protein
MGPIAGAGDLDEPLGILASNMALDRREQDRRDEEWS